MEASEASRKIVEGCEGDPERLRLAKEVVSLVCDGVASEREACASLIETIRMSEILLASGEMSAQERRTVKALLPWLAHRIRTRVHKAV